MRKIENTDIIDIQVDTVVCMAESDFPAVSFAFDVKLYYTQCKTKCKLSLVSGSTSLNVHCTYMYTYSSTKIKEVNQYEMEYVPS